VLFPLLQGKEKKIDPTSNLPSIPAVALKKKKGKKYIWEMCAPRNEKGESREGRRPAMLVWFGRPSGKKKEKNFCTSSIRPPWGKEKKRKEGRGSLDHRMSPAFLKKREKKKRRAGNRQGRSGAQPEGFAQKKKRGGGSMKRRLGLQFPGLVQPPAERVQKKKGRVKGRVDARARNVPPPHHRKKGKKGRGSHGLRVCPAQEGGEGEKSRPSQRTMRTPMWRRKSPDLGKKKNM